MFRKLAPLQGLQVLFPTYLAEKTSPKRIKVFLDFYFYFFHIVCWCQFLRTLLHSKVFTPLNCFWTIIFFHYGNMSEYIIEYNYVVHYLKKWKNISYSAVFLPLLYIQKKKCFKVIPSAVSKFLTTVGKKIIYKMKC